MTINAELLTRARLPKYELDQLKASLLEFLDGMGNDIEGAFAQAVPSDAIQLPGVTLADRVTQGLVRRIRRLTGSGV